MIYRVWFERVSSYYYVVQNLRRAPRRCLKPNRWLVSVHIIFRKSSSPQTIPIIDRNDLIAFSGTAVNMLLAFSVRRNFRQICDKSIGEDTISTVHGLRSLSMVWIVLGHVCIVSFKYSGNYIITIIVICMSSRSRNFNETSICIISYNKICICYLDNMEFRTTAERHLLFQLINKATYSVDTFFFIR